jgi:hypothetical protein
MLKFLAGIIVGTNCFFLQEYALKAYYSSGTSREVYAIFATLNALMGACVALLVIL